MIVYDLELKKKKKNDGVDNRFYDTLDTHAWRAKKNIGVWR